MKTNNKYESALIDNILILGLKSEELNSLQSLKIEEIEKMSLKYKAVVLENYSINKIYDSDDEFFKKICEYSFPGGVINSSEDIFNKNQYITFCIRDNSNQYKHITCSYIQSGLKISDKNIITINTGIVLISSMDIYECHKEILSHFIDIITNYFIKNSTITNNAKNREVYLTNVQPNEAFEEYRLIPFYISFFLNLVIKDSNKNNICLSYVSNNFFQNILCKITLNSKKNNSILLLKEYDTSIILEKFYIDDLIKLYCAILLDKSIILIFNDYYEINILIYSLLSIIYPFNNTKKYNINFIYNKSELQGKKLIKNDELNNLIGVYFNEDDDLSFLPEEGTTPSFASTNSTNLNNNINENTQYLPYLNFYYSKNAFVYSIKDKKFLNCPFDNENREENNLLPDEITNDIKSQLYFVLGEKLTINSDMNFDDSDLSLIFDNSTCKKLNTFLYLNLKIKAIFFRVFLLLMNGINSYLNFNYNFNNTKDDSMKNTNDYFKNINQFTRDSKFKQNLINNKNIKKFLIKYIKKHKSNSKYAFIYKTLNDIKNKNYNEINNYLENVFKEQIRSGIINYYNFDYVNFDKYFTDYIKYQEKENNKNPFLLNSSKNYTLFQLINIDGKIIENNNLFFKENPYTNYIETTKSFLNKFQIYKIYNSVKSIQQKKINKLSPSPYKPIEPKLSTNSKELVLNNNSASSNKEKTRIIPNFDNILGQILNGEELSNFKGEINKVEPKRELCSESKKFKFKKMKKEEPSPFKNIGMATAVGRNSSYYNQVNNPFLKNDINFKEKKQYLKLGTGNGFQKKTQSFRCKKAVVKSKNKIINNNNLGSVLGESDGQINNFKERSSKRKYTYNLEDAHKTLKKLTISNNRNKNKDILKGPITSTKKYENNYGHLPKLAGDLDDELLSDEDSLK